MRWNYWRDVFLAIISPSILSSLAMCAVVTKQVFNGQLQLTSFHISIFFHDTQPIQVGNIPAL